MRDLLCDGEAETVRRETGICSGRRRGGVSHGGRTPPEHPEPDAERAIGRRQEIMRPR